jgi:hypothetical protein
MPSSKRVTGNFNFWTGNTGNWSYANAANTGNVTNIRRGISDTRFYSSNLQVYGNIVSLGGDIYANKIYADIVGNIVLEGNATNFGILYKNPSGNASVSTDFLIDDANQAATMTGNINIVGTGAGNLNANNVSSNNLTTTSAVIAQANVTGNLTVGGNITVAYIRAVDYLDISGNSIVYGNINVFTYLSDNVDTKEIKLGTTSTGNINGNGFINILGVVNTAANVNGLYFNGNGRFLTGILESYGNANVANYLPLYTGGLPNLTGNVVTTANISAAYILGNITQATGYFVYGNANVATYLPVYTGDLNPNNIVVSGLAEFSNVGNVRIPGGNAGQALFADGLGNLLFSDVTATPGNLPGSFQYNSNGNALYGLDDFVYDTSNISTPNVRISNLSLNIYKGDGSFSEDQLLVSGNIKLLTATVGNVEQANTGVMSLGGINKLNLEDLQLSNLAGYLIAVTANGQQINYSNQVSQLGVGTNSSGTDGTIVSSGNITGANLITGGLISATGNITGNYFFGNGSQLTGIDATLIESGNSNVKVVSSNGNVTINVSGTSNVAVFSTVGLNVDGAVSITGNISAGNIAGIVRPTSGNTQAGIIFPNDIGGGSGDAAYIKYYATTGENTVLELNASNDSDDNIYLNATGGTDVQNDLRATGNIIAFFSDERLKTRLGNIENALDKIDQLSTFYFEPNDIAVNTYGYTRHRDIGVSAQEVANVVPEIIADAPIGHGYLTVKYERFAPLIIAAIKELRVEIADIKKKIDK